MFKESLTFDDVMLVPQYSELKSRKDVDLSINLNNLKFNHPIVPANMKTIMSYDMIWEIIKSGGLAILHRFMDIDEQFNIAEDVIDNFGWKNFAVSVGAKDEDKANIEKFWDLGVKIFNIDLAHGDSCFGMEMTKFIRDQHPSSIIISGNVATGIGAIRLWQSGANVVRVGVGNGSICTTRIQTGNGVPLLSSLIDVYQSRQRLNSSMPLYILSDGGAKSSGDLVKALCFADFVMSGNLFGGCEECPGDIINIDGVMYKSYEGSSTHKNNYIEGVKGKIPLKGYFEDVLEGLLEGIRSGCSYQGVSNLKDLKENPEFVKITPAGMKESNYHDIKI